MKYKLVYTLRAVKDIEKLEPRTKARIGKTLLRYKDNPLKYAKKLTDPKLGSYRFRVGDFRVIFDIEGDEIVGKEIYRR